MTHRPRFNVADVVRRRSAPEQLGVIRAVLPNEQLDEQLYKVQLGTQSRTVSERDLELLPDEADSWADLLDHRTEGAATFQKLLTFERLRRPPSRVATSFGTARAKLLPYQFKPLLKFLDNPNQRILIADDVGLGKTVEAGYILKELKARHGLDRVLVVVPARLRPKWKTELERRFDESFEIVSAKEVRERFIEPYQRGRDLPSFAWIASYESLRGREIIKTLAELQPPIDLVIMDEAHKVRNSDTLQHAMARALAQADAMVLLTATPIQTSREDLFQLLRLMDPQTFERYDVFEAQLQANRPVVQALAAIRQNPPDVEAARGLLMRLKEQPLTQNLTTTEFFSSLLERLDAERLKERRALVDLQRDISELNLTSHVLSRTRKVEVMPDRPVRHASACKVVLTAEERRVYQAIGKIAFLANASSGWGAVMAAMMVFRFAASCLPAAREYCRTKFGQTLDALCGDLEVDTSEENDAPAAAVGMSGIWTGLKGDLETELPVDTKFLRFREALDELWREDARRGAAPRKVIVFSYFRGTLRYLERRLAELRVSTRVIHGLIPVPEREQLIDEFLRNTAIHVLVSSEVGSEGLDLQQASVVINYDLPWNPMVVEQRIGRIDRLGQESPVLTILSLVLSDTIEDRILYRLYERIGIFKETIGEIEPILGEQIERLAVAALRNELTPEEQERQADQAADAFLREQRQGQTLQQQADQLIAGDQAFLDEIQSLIGERRVPAPRELHRFLEEFMGRRYPGSVLPVTTLDKVAEVVLDTRVAIDLLEQVGADPEIRRIASRIQQGAFLATFDADAHMRRPYSELISIHHPLVRLACAFLERDVERLHRAFHLRLAGDGDIACGEYLLAILEFSISGIRARTEIVPVLWSLDNGVPLDADVSRHAFVRLLDQAVGVEALPPLARDEFDQQAHLLKRHLGNVRAEIKTRETTLQAARAARRRATQQATLESKVRAAKQRLHDLEGRQATEFPTRMAKAKLQQEQNRLDAFLRDAGEAAPATIDEREVAIAVVSVVPSVTGVGVAL
jgi:superfamily II DNA or RNA helicase